MKNNKVSDNFFYSMMYQLLLIILPIVTTPYVSRILGVENIGLYSYSYTMAALFVLFANLGISNYGTRSIAKVKRNPVSLNRIFSSIYTIQLLTSGLTIIAYVVYVFILADDMLAAFLAGSYVLSTIFDLNWVLYGLEDFKFSTIRSSLVKISSVFLIFLTVKEPDDIYIYIFILCGSFLINNLVIVPYLYHNRIKFIKLKTKDVIVHIKPILVLFIPILGMSVYKYMNKVILAHYFTLNEVGFLESSERVMLVPISFVIALGNVMLPRMSELYAKGNIKDADKYTENSFYFAAAVSSAMGFGLIAVIREFVPLFYGDGFDKNAEIIPILMISAIFLAIANVIRTQYLIPKGKDKEYVISILVGAIVNICIALILIPSFASVGAAISIVSAEFAVCATQIFLSRKERNMLKYIVRSSIFILTGVLMSVIVYNISFSFGLLITITLKILIGFVIIIILNTFALLLLKNMDE